MLRIIVLYWLNNILSDTKMSDHPLVCLKVQKLIGGNFINNDVFFAEIIWILSQLISISLDFDYILISNQDQLVFQHTGRPWMKPSSWFEFSEIIEFHDSVFDVTETNHSRKIAYKLCHFEYIHHDC